MPQTLTTEAGVPFLRTPESAFEGLTDYPFAGRYVSFEGLRLAYVDEGPRDGPVALLMHGMPTWSYLNRKIIRRLVAAGWRCVAADHIGFGRSDKVTDDGWYSIARHVAAHRLLIETLDLRAVTLFCQDWGGPIGLAQAAEQPERFSRLVVMNTWLHHAAYAYTDALRQWNAQWQADGLFGINIPEKLSLGWFMMLPLGHMKPADLFGIIGTGTYRPDPGAGRRAPWLRRPLRGPRPGRPCRPPPLPPESALRQPSGRGRRGPGALVRGPAGLAKTHPLCLGRERRGVHRGLGPSLGGPLSAGELRPAARCRPLPPGDPRR
ncbi:MAG: alpha/beta fold hydrolase [Pseudomonadota bacterium]